MSQTGEVTRTVTTGTAQAPFMRRDVMASDCDTVVVGAGPYGLAAAAHLQGAGIETAIFGGAMSFWRENMPKGMLLRSPWPGCHISDPRGEFTLDHYRRVRGMARVDPLPLERFVDYGQWFQQQVAPDLDGRSVVRIAASPAGAFEVALEDGATLKARRVVVAAGLAAQTYRPPQFDQIPPALATHYSEHNDFARFNGRRVVVVGAGQGALESAVLLSENGAEVHLLARGPEVRWLGGGPGPAGVLERLKRIVVSRLNPPAPIGPFPFNWMVEKPLIFRMMPPTARRGFAARVLRPCGAAWLVPRLNGLHFHTGVQVASARESGGSVALKLTDGSTILADHVLLGTGYRVNIARYRFLAPELVDRVRCMEGHPSLNDGMESSVPRLHFVGAPATRDFGPLLRFVAGTGYAARRLARHAVAERAR